jgi:hypothetical protein
MGIPSQLTSGAGRPARRLPSGRRWLAVVVAVLAACGVAGAFSVRRAPSKSILLGDTWTWDGSTWTQQHPVPSPSARTDASMAYDAATGTVVLFGGGGKTSPPQYHLDLVTPEATARGKVAQALQRTTDGRAGVRRAGYR